MADRKPPTFFTLVRYLCIVTGLVVLAFLVGWLIAFLLGYIPSPSP